MGYNAKETKESVLAKLNALDTITLEQGVTLSDATIIMSNLPTSDPGVAGQLWTNTLVVTMSAG